MRSEYTAAGFRTPIRVTLTDTTMRDGLQSESQVVPTDRKTALLTALLQTGITRFEITSFMNPRVVPQTADADDLVSRIERRPGTTFLALVPNLRGAIRAIAAGVDELIFLLTATEAYTMRNTRMTIADTFDQLERVRDLAKERRVRICAAIGVAFGCPIEGPVPLSRVLHMIDRSLELGADSVEISDTIGVATPGSMRQVLMGVFQEWPELPLGLHLHDNRGQALANALCALQMGIARFDTAAGGLGGSPMYKGSAGNLCTEDFVYMLEGMGISSGTSLEKLVECAELARQIVGHDVPGRVLRAGIHPPHP